jgi:hypothetical protein
LNRKLRGRAAVTAAVSLIAACFCALALGATPIVPKKNALLGGGWISPAYTGVTHPNLTLVNVRVSANSKTANVYLDLTAPCQGTYSAYKVPVTVKAVPVAGGTFSLKGQMHDQDPNSAGQYTITGRFLSPTSAAGTASETFAYKNGGVMESCITPTIHWQARADTNMTSAAGKPALRKGAFYYGNTSQTYDMVLRLTPDGRHVAQAAALMDEHCSKDPANYVFHVDPVASLSTAISANGSFTDTVVIHNAAFTTRDGVSASGELTEKMAGRFGASSVVGTWQVTEVLHDSTGALIDTCTSKVVKFKADL